MAYGNFLLDKGYDADAALLKDTAVKRTDTGVDVATAGGADFYGVVQFGVTTAEIGKGKGASVRVDGITEWVAGGAVAIDDEVTVGSDGKCVLATGGDTAVGRCIDTPATNDGDVTTVRIYGGGHVV